jgi:uncharacterized membrane protein HdeD (DUF308 family)
MNNHSRVGGILNIITGALGILMGIGLIIMFIWIYWMVTTTVPAAAISEEFPLWVFLLYVVIGIVVILLSVVPVVGGIFALNRKHWGWALAGGICGNLVFPFSGIPALVFICLGRDEFQPSTDALEAGAASPAPALAVNPRITGVLNFVAGGMGILTGLSCFFFAAYFFPEMRSLSGYNTYDLYSTDMMSNFYYVYGIIAAVGGIIALIGGRFALQRKHWGWALAGAIAGVVTFYPCGVAAIVYAVAGKEEFDTESPLLTE